MIRILYVISDRNIGGAGVLLCNLLRHLNRREFSCAVALPFGSRLRERLLSLKVRIFELQNRCDILNAPSVKELAAIIQKFDADLIHANAAISARMAGKLCRKSVVHTRHCCFEIPDRKLFQRTAQNVANRLLSDRVIATSRSAAENLKELGIPSSKIRVILNGSEPVRRVEDWELDELRARLDLKEDDFCVGLCARLEPYKGHSIFLRAAERIKNTDLGEHVKFLIVGEGSTRGHLEQNIRILGLENMVRMVGFVEDMAPIYRLLRINVNCSCGTETSCLAISEGMSASLPTIATDYGGNSVMIGKSGAGILIPVGDDRALAEAVCRIASDGELEAKMANAAYRRYWERFTAEEMASRTEDVYRELLEL